MAAFIRLAPSSSGAVGQNAAGKMSDQELKDIEQHAIPGTGSCGGMYTANTMSSAFEALGILMTDTCINYQTIMPPVRGEHCAYGDTGVVIYSNSVCGARSNFEGGPSALSAGLTGRTPRYGYHLDEHRLATLVVQTSYTPRELNEWGALGGIVGRLSGDYWQVPALIGIHRVPGSDELKHFGAALASYGSVALFHMVGITPEAERLTGLARVLRVRRPQALVPPHDVVQRHVQRRLQPHGDGACRRGQPRCRSIDRHDLRPQQPARRISTTLAIAPAR